MTDPWTALGLVTAGLAAGWLGGALGIGGGVILVPVLHLGLGMSIASSVGTSLLVITATATAAGVGYLREDVVDPKWAVQLGAGALLGAIAASTLAARIAPQVVAALFSAILVLVAVRMAWPKRDIAARRQRPLLAIATMPVAGAVAGLLGVGGGVVQVPVLRLLLGREMRQAVATSTVMVGWTASVAAVAYLKRGDLNLIALPWLLIGVLVGATAAPATTRWINPRVLEMGFALVLLWTAWRMAGG